MKIMNKIINNFFSKKKDLQNLECFKPEINKLLNHRSIQYKMITGVDCLNNQINISDHISNVFIAGNAGSGKSNVAVMISSMFLMANSINTKLNVIDVNKGALDYQFLKKYNQVDLFTDEHSSTEFLNKIKLEINDRIKKMRFMHCSNLKELELKTNIIITRHVIVVEESHSCLNELMTENDWQPDLRRAQAAGIYFIVVTQKASIWPASFWRRMFDVKFSFKQNNMETMALLGDYDLNWREFSYFTERLNLTIMPYINRCDLENLLDANVKPLTSKSFVLDK